MTEVERIAIEALERITHFGPLNNDAGAAAIRVALDALAAIRALERPPVSAEAMEWAAQVRAGIKPDTPSKPLRQFIEEQRAK